MKLPVLTALILVFIVWINYEIHKTSKHTAQDDEHFWKREKDSNFSRRADITSLDYITLTTDRLPLADNPDETVNSYRDTILKLSGKKILNLSGITNTELKFKYGVVNINQLTEYDNNYTALVSILQKWAERLYNNGNIDDCEAVLKYAVSCYTDVTKSYKLLAEIYAANNRTKEIDELVDVIAKTRIVEKDKLINELMLIKNI